MKKTAKAPANAPGNPNLAKFDQNARRYAWIFRTLATVLAAKKADGSATGVRAMVASAARLELTYSGYGFGGEKG